MTKILVIEDTQSLLIEIIETLQLEGFEARGAENGVRGVEIAKEYLPDLIICDVMMPELDGYGTLAALQNYLPTATTPFIFLTAKADRVDMRYGMELGAHDYLTKPFATNELLGAIAAQLKKVQALQSQNDLAIQAAITKHEAKILELKSLDNPLSNPPNRISFPLYLQEEIHKAQARQCSLALIFIDIDDFNLVNNSLGHRIGDILLKAVADRLREKSSDLSFVRTQGDQFGMILIDCPESQKLRDAAQEILDFISKPYCIFGHEIFITACLGISVYPQDHLEAANLIKNADMALYFAKSQGRNNYKFYSSSLNVRLSEQMAIENSLRRALERKEFRLYYQPVINSLNQEIIGAEALIRWQHPDIGIILPEKFMFLAEATGMITPITEWILEQACKQLKIWQDFLSEPQTPSQKISDKFYVAVNLSAFSFKQDQLLAMISKTVKTANIAYSDLELEITEAAVRQNQGAAISTLISLRDLGIKIAINDFGVGYSSISYLRHLPIDKIKIDRCFIADMLNDSHGAAITLAIIELAHNLDLTIVAEGVETTAQLNFLQKNGCELIQGFLFSTPLPAEEFTRLLVAGKIVEQKII